ncbi:patatin-like phospholipase family protein [Polaribacter dokdonensis]|uniref:NTE family protein n=1 Tax=Polaribacter dokdonensis DSW-5 TaxID=1300348 RepID=A0A0N0UNH1_9FLAO|nr:patatin-like phospholipase family protein [Polaribacter dokdonensis]KOY51487.1 Patatin-like phospholipase [Polaribacter dokdonensis DSW-5]SEE10325.1 NTE family protein [Polaribacter dokdonensis DSW-5]
MKNKLILILLLPWFVFAQQTQPKVGLVLSGGGAKGFAHIGVLKEIDKAGIQLDYIAGTSMGAIIGGLYAAGYSAVQIEDIVVNTDFMTLLRDQIPRSSETFFEKEYGEKTVITLPVNNGKIGFPRGISKGQNVLNLLLELFDSLDGNQDFSKLATPFFCIATDVENGNPIVLESGSLPIALRASGSFPSLLNPVEVGDKLLVDGGIANNFPVSIMKDKGIDIVIGVDVEGKLFQKEKINSVVALLNQIVSYQMYNKSDEEIKKLDVYIHPEIYDFSVVDFERKEEILEKGELAAKKYTKVFEEIAAKQTIKKKRTDIEINTSKMLISDIALTGNNNYTRSYVLGKLNILEGDSLSRQEVTKRIHLLSATRNYNKIEYNFIKKVDGSYLLNFNLTESNEKANLKLGVHYDFLYKSGVLANYNHKRLFGKNDMLAVDFILGDNLRYDLNYFVDNGFYISYGIRSRYDHFRANSKFNLVITDEFDINNINIKYTDITNQLYLQTTFGRKFAIGLGLEHKYIKISTETIVVNSGETILDNSEYLNAFGYIKLDTYDQKYFVTKGYFADLRAKWFINSTNHNQNFKRFLQTRGTLGFATTFFDKLTFQLTNEAGFTFDNPDSSIFDFYLGGYNQNYINTFTRFYGYDFAELSDLSYVKSELNIRYRFADRHYANFIANYARLDTNVFKDIDLFTDIKSGYAVGYSYNSIIGPIELKYAWSPDTKQNFWLFNLGFWF